MKVWGIHEWREWREDDCGTTHIFSNYKKARLYCEEKAKKEGLEEESFGDYWGDDRIGFIIEEFVVE